MFSLVVASTVILSSAEPPAVSVMSGVPSDADVLYDGTSLAKWRNINGGPAGWKIQADGTLLVNKEGNTPGAVLASIYTKDVYTNFQMQASPVRTRVQKSPLYKAPNRRHPRH